MEFAFTLPEPAEAPASRAAIGDDGRGMFEEGDRISLYVDDSARHYILTLRNGSWTPRLTRQELGGGLVTLNACYPADEEAGGGASSRVFRLPSDQSGEGYAASDILWVNRTGDMDNLSGNRIELPFTHGLYRLRFILKSESGELPSDLEVAVKSAAGGSFSFFSGQVRADGSGTAWIAPRAVEGEAGSFQAIVVPQPLKELQSGDGWIRVASGGRTAYFRTPDKIGGSANLEPGKESLVTLRLKADGGVEPDPGGDIDEKWMNVKRWIFGVKSSIFDPATVVSVPLGSLNYPRGVWVDFWYKWPDGIYTHQYRLMWTEGCGWYDVSKTYTSDGAKDRDMCWAASTSNVMHWWLEHNAPFVAAYDEKYKDDPDYKKYPRPSAEFHPYPARSAIFNGLFVSTFKDQGAGEGGNWFISGAPGWSLGVIVDPGMLNFKGYFKEVFPRSVNMYEYNPAMSKASFNRVLKDALENRKVLAFVINGNHNMTIWGAEFDERGYASYLYYVDNNPYGEPDPGGAAVFRKEITYREDAAMGLKDQAYLGNYDRITLLGAVPLRQDIWRRAFPEVQASENEM